MGKLAEVLAHPCELLPLLRAHRAIRRVCGNPPSDPDLAFCYSILNKVSASFAFVIQQLPQPARDVICVLYLVLRGLDTVEDDMALPNEVKLPALLAFHKSIYDRNFRMDCGTKHYKRLMANFGAVVNVFLGLEPKYRAAIVDCTRRMGDGMAKFITQEVETVAQYNEYCGYVAGLVGIALSQIFAASGLESEAYFKADELSNHMGLFLQKTNIIRDYLEDIMEEPAPRMYWPREVWARHAEKLADFKYPANRAAALRCLNHLVVDALQHVPYCLEYMHGLQDPAVFKFWSIPQIMSLGTLAQCFNNGAVFEGPVKLRRGQIACVLDACGDMREVYNWYLTFLRTIKNKLRTVDAQDPCLELAQQTIASQEYNCLAGLQQWRAQRSHASVSRILWDYAALMVVGVYTYKAWGLGTDVVPGLPSGLMDRYQRLHAALSVVLLLLVLRAAIFLR